MQPTFNMLKCVLAGSLLLAHQAAHAQTSSSTSDSVVVTVSPTSDNAIGDSAEQTGSGKSKSVPAKKAISKSASGSTDAPAASIPPPPPPTGLPTPPPLYKKGYQIFGTLRIREEDYNWFPTSKANGNYTFLGGYARVGVSRSTRTEDVVLEVAAPFFEGLPHNATAPSPQGGMGHGASYYAANGNRTAGLFIKNGYINFKNVGSPTTSVKLGRFEYGDGIGVFSADPTLAWLKQNRITQRLIGASGFNDVGRSFDGLLAVDDTPRRHLTAAFLMPTRGVYDLNGSDTLTDVRMGYLAATYPQPGPHASGEGRIFAMQYEDGRDGDTVKVDNRPSATRALDKSQISITTLGGNYERVEPLGNGKVDAIFWGAAQTGRWGTERQGAFAFAAEVGYQPKLPLKPWFRFGYDYFSGDGKAADGIHGTFFPMTFTSRQYARTPFFTESNLKDLFGQVILRPSKRLTLRTDVHGLKLAQANDLWYTGSGPYTNQNFGYTGRTSSGHNNLATLYDTSLDYQVSRNLSFTLYFGFAEGGDVVRAIYSGRDMTFCYAETNFRF